MLRPETERVWAFLKEQRALEGFILIGGSALALRTGHRRSEDLDLVITSEKLPRARIEALLRAGRSAGFQFLRIDDEATLHEFLEEGLDVLDYQQNFIVDGSVKVSMFVPDPPLGSVLSTQAEDRVRLATLKELFQSKCLVSAVRSKSRDWLDLYVLFTQHGFSFKDYYESFRAAGISAQYETGLTRLCSGIPQKDDEGFAHLMANPPSIEQMAQYFRQQRNLLETALAKEVKPQTMS